MVKKHKIYLAQTDTTIGFLSHDFKLLNRIKNRPLNTPCIKSVATLRELKKHARVPNLFKNLVRKAKKTSFIYPNKQAIRFVQTSPHKEFILKHNWLYSTSANITKHDFDEKYARMVADEVIEHESGFSQQMASKIFKINIAKKVKIRS